MIMLNPRQVDQIYYELRKYQDHYGTLMPRERMKTLFCPNVSKYKDKELIRMSYNFDRGGKWSDNRLVTTGIWNKISCKGNSYNTKIYLGEVNGKHSEVILYFKDILKETVSDPYEIHDIAKHHNVFFHEGNPQDDDFLSNFEYIFDYSEWEGKVMLDINYKDNTIPVLISEEFWETFGGDQKINIGKYLYGEDSKDDIVEIGSITRNEYYEPKEIDDWFYSQGEDYVEEEDFKELFVKN